MKSVVLDSGETPVIVTQSLSIEAVRDILICELLSGDWDLAEDSYDALNSLLNKEVILKYEDEPSKPPTPVNRPTNPSI